jgi:CubicO group peptidase (beta-lactamase class C family)
MEASEVIAGGGPGDFARIRHVRLEGTQAQIGSGIADLAWATVADMNTPAWRRAEIPAGNAHTTAGPGPPVRHPGLWRAGGRRPGSEPAQHRAARTERASGPDAVLFGPPTRFGLGFSLPPKDTGFGSSSDSAFGYPGADGSIGFADPAAHLGFGYIMNQMLPGMPPGPTCSASSARCTRRCDRERSHPPLRNRMNRSPSQGIIGHG